VVFKVEPVVLTEVERVELERRVRAHTSQVRERRRAQVILLCAEGVSLHQIGERVDMNEHQVTLWRRRFLAKRLDGLIDAQRPGRPRRFGHDERIKIAATATSARQPDDPVSTWTCVEVTEALRQDGLNISVSQVWRILDAMDIDLSKVRGWINRRDDPEFWDRVRDVCGLYLSPPVNALVLSVDEKTGIQAKERIHSDRPAQPGQHARREFEYRRHGTAKLVAALDVATGQILADTIDRNDAVTFIAFLETIEAATDPNVEIHMILDNGSSHTAKLTRAWLLAHPRWQAHFTPKHASWVNQIELFFSILQRKVIRRGNFTSQDDLVTKMLKFITEYDQTSRPFAWTYAADPLKIG
jgi:transposase